jgi:dolichol-phosphate mannosyltransferase
MPELAVIVPTLNERANLRPLLAALERALGGVDYEVVFVDDDSDDGTSSLARAVAQTDRRVRILQRIGRRGLAGAVVEGMLSTSAPYLAVIDGDLQHDESVLPRMLTEIRNSDADLVVGTRNAEGGGMGDFAKSRVKLSRWGQAISRAVCPKDLSDPMSGFFLVRRTFFNRVVHGLSLTGFKILLDMVATAGHGVRIREVPYQFRTRQAGESKLDAVTAFEFGILLVDKITRGLLPVNYLRFGVVGGVGILGNAILPYLLRGAGVPRTWSYGAAGLAIIILNFFLNNLFTFRMHRLTGVRRWNGLAIFSIACAVGLMLNLSVSNFLQQAGLGGLPAGAAGIVTASVWNYWIAAVFVWRMNRRRTPFPEEAPAVLMAEERSIPRA